MKQRLVNVREPKYSPLHARRRIAHQIYRYELLIGLSARWTGLFVAVECGEGNDQKTTIATYEEVAHHYPHLLAQV